MLTRIGPRKPEISEGPAVFEKRRELDAFVPHLDVENAAKKW
jgi:hypothetical protein